MPPASAVPPRAPALAPGLATALRRLAALGVAVLLLCALLNAADIATRRLLLWPFSGLVDLTQLLVMTSAFLCIPHTFALEAQIEVDFVSTRLPARAQAWLRALTALLGAGFMAAVTAAVTAGALQAAQHGDRSATLALPLTWYWAPVLLGCALSVLACLALAVAHGQRAWRLRT